MEFINKVKELLMLNFLMRNNKPMKMKVKNGMKMIEGA